MKKCLIITLLCIFTLSLTNSCNNNDTKAQIEKCIEEGDFNKAKQLNKKLEYGGMKLKICKAQVSSLIDKGEFNLAADIAKEDTDYGVYYENLMGKLVQLYVSNPQGLLMALSSIQFPKNGNSCHWNGDYEVFYTDDLNKVYSEYNNYVKQLAIYAKANGDLEYVKRLSPYFKPLYKSKKVKEPDKTSVSGYYEYTEWESTPTDYSQANQIKKELGI